VPDSENAGVSAFLRSHLSEGMVVIDVGANVGDVTAAAADAVGSGGRVIAFEPGPSNARKLQERFATSSHVEVHQAAVTDRSGSLQLHLDAASSRRHSLYPSIVSVPGESILVPAVRLDDVSEKIGSVHFIKIDAQGAEARILSGARAMIERDHPVIVFELWPAGMIAAGGRPADVFAYLERLRYRFVRLSVKGRQKSRGSIDAFLATTSRWASINVIAWPSPRRLTLWERVQRRLTGAPEARTVG
jgi:FkbM family methyltransferase